MSTPHTTPDANEGTTPDRTDTSLWSRLWARYGPADTLDTDHLPVAPRWVWRAFFLAIGAFVLTQLAVGEIHSTGTLLPPGTDVWHLSQMDPGEAVRFAYSKRPRFVVPWWVAGLGE